MRRAAFLLFLCLLLAVLTFPVKVNLVHAYNAHWVPYIFETIQEAINYAQNGDEIIVAAGTYNENVVVNKSVALWSYYSQKAGINGDGSSETISIQADNVTLWGFNITNDGFQPAIILHSVSGVKVTGNFIGTGLADSIRIAGGAHNYIVNNWFEPCRSGIMLTDSNENLIMGNQGSGHSYAIDMLRCDFNRIFKNYLGIHFSTSPAVIRLHSSNSNTFEENTLETLGTGGNPIIDLWDAVNNSIFHNNFLWGVHGMDTGGSNSDNRWNKGSEGNYWWDYGGSDLDGDGIGDTSYLIEGDFMDEYPLMKPYSWWNIGDINRDWKVDIFDIVQLCGHYASTVLDHDWSFVCDIAKPWGTIDIYDLVVVASSYGSAHTASRDVSGHEYLRNHLKHSNSG